MFGTDVLSYNFTAEVKPIPAPRRPPDFHDVPYDTPTPSGNSSNLIENSHPIYENINNDEGIADFFDQCCSKLL